MNFIPCRMEEANGSLSIRITDALSFPVPPARAEHYRGHAQNGRLSSDFAPSTSPRLARTLGLEKSPSMPISR